MKYSLIIVFLVFSKLAFADSWGSPTLTSTMSDDSSIIVRIVPGDGYLNHDKRSSDKPFAEANYFRWDGVNGYVLYQNIILKNPAAPIYSLITDDGKLITVDNWYSTGSGKVVVTHFSKPLLAV